MMDYLRLDEVCNLNMGQSPSSDSYNQEGKGIPFFQGNADFGELYPITRVWCDEPTKIVDKGTLLISVRAPIGALNFATEKSCIGRGLAGLTVKAGYDLKYIYYVLKFKEQELNNKGTGSTFKAISKSSLGEVLVPDISIGKQKDYVKKLDLIQRMLVDEKKQMVQLDMLIKSRFIEMFGELLLNPMAWNEYPLGAVCDKVVRYPTFYGMEYLPSGTRVIRIGNILPDGHMELDDENYVFVYDTVNEDFPETVIELNDIIMAVRGDGSAAKRIGIITEPSLIDANISPNLIRIKVNNTMLNPIYLFYYLTGEVGQKRLDAYVNKTAKKNVAAKDIVKIVTPVPPLPLQNDFASFVHQVDKLKVAAQETLNETQKLFNSLMQQYFG